MSPGDVRVAVSVTDGRHYCLILSSVTDGRTLCMIITSHHAVLADVSSCDVKRFYKLDLDWC